MALITYRYCQKCGAMEAEPTHVFTGEITSVLPDGSYVVELDRPSIIRPEPGRIEIRCEVVSQPYVERPPWE